MEQIARADIAAFTSGDSGLANAMIEAVADVPDDAPPEMRRLADAARNLVRKVTEVTTVAPVTEQSTTRMSSRSEPLPDTPTESRATQAA